jgi:uncharacterized glyoxalase superfamily protein PhnB
MNTTKLVPIISTAETEAAKQFYQRHFDFKIIFEAMGYVALRAPGGNVEIAFMQPCERELPFRGDGVTLAFNVANVDEEHERLRAAGVAIVQPPEDKPWGDRSIIVRDPVGVWVYLSHPIPASPEMQKLIKE